ncbi:MAG: hypothetical protein ABR577_04650 [Pyrinomonadaceae bacterium]
MKKKKSTLKATQIRAIMVAVLRLIIFSIHPAADQHIAGGGRRSPLP